MKTELLACLIAAQPAHTSIIEAAAPLLQVVCCDVSKTVAANQLTELVIVHSINLLFRVLLACWLVAYGSCANLCILCSCGNKVVLETSLLLRNCDPRTPCSRDISLYDVLMTAGCLWYDLVTQTGNNRGSFLCERIRLQVTSVRVCQS